MLKCLIAFVRAPHDNHARFLNGYPCDKPILWRRFSEEYKMSCIKLDSVMPISYSVCILT